MWKNLEVKSIVRPVMRTFTTGKQVLFIRRKKHYYEAKDICQSICGDIFLPISREENREAVNLLNDQATTGRYMMSWLRASDRIWINIF